MSHIPIPLSYPISALSKSTNALVTLGLVDVVQRVCVGLGDATTPPFLP